MSEIKGSINEKMAKLDELLAWFEGDSFELEAAGAKFTEAKQLAISIEQDLDTIKNDIRVLSEQFDKET